MVEHISSLQNSRIKNIVKLQEKSSERRNQGLVVVEGLREIGLALEAGLIIDTLFYCDDFKDFTASIVPQAQAVFSITKEVFNKIAYREDSDGVLALFKPRFYTLQNLKLSANPFLIVVEGVEKPGNLGAILRTADAAQADAVIVCDPRSDIYNPNVIRSSVGCVFTTQVVACTSDELQEWIKQKEIIPYAAALTATRFYQDTDFVKACAVVFGTEADGLTSKWLNNSIEQIKIPMRGKIDSLNVSNSVAIIAFEAMRQRGFKE